MAAHLRWTASGGSSGSVRLAKSFAGRAPGSALPATNLPRMSQSIAKRFAQRIVSTGTKPVDAPPELDHLGTWSAEIISDHRYSWGADTSAMSKKPYTMYVFKPSRPVYVKLGNVRPRNASRLAYIAHAGPDAPPEVPKWLVASSGGQYSPSLTPDAMAVLALLGFVATTWTPLLSDEDEEYDA